MKFQLDLRRRVVLLVVAALLPLLGLSIITAQLNADVAVSRATDNLKFAVSLAASNQRRMTETVHQVLTAIAHVPEVRDGPVAACNRYLEALKRQLSDYVNLGIAGADGNVRCHGLGGSPAAYVGDRAYFRDAVARRSFVAGEYILGRASEKPSVTFALPVLDEDGRVAFVAFAALDLTEMTRSITAIELPAGAALGIHDRNGALLAGTPGLPLRVGQTASSPVLLEAIRTRRTGVHEGLDGWGEQRLWAFMPSSPQAHTAFTVAVSMDRSLVVAPSQGLLRLELAALALVALIGGWMAWMLGGRAIVKPAAKILEATRQFQQGRLGVRIAISSKDETDELSQISAAFNRMAESMQAHQGALEAELLCSQSAQQKLQDAQSLARIGNWQIDLVTGLLWWSDETYAIFDIDRALFDGTYDGFLRQIHPADRASFMLSRDAAVAAGEPLETEFRIVTTAGQVRWIHQFGRGQCSAEGLPTARRSGVVQDITKRKNAELAMVRSTELLHRTGALAKIGGWELAVETMVPYWTEEIYRIHELDCSSTMGLEAATRFYAREAQPLITAAIKAALQDATPWDMELPLTTAKGRQIWVRTQGRAMLEDGKVARLVGVLQDITAQHEAQEHLRLLETCISRLNDVVMITEADPNDKPGPRIVFVNEAFERRTGYSSQEVLGKSPLFLQGPKTQRSELDRIRSALENKHSVRAELINYTKSGREFWVELDIVPVSDAKGDITHWVAVERDITERKLAEQTLIESEQRYAALFELAPVPMWVYDIATTRFLAVNHAAVQAYGYSAAEFLAMTIFDLRPEAEQACLRLWLDNPSRKKALWHDLRKDGSLFSVETVSEPIQYAGRAAGFVVAMDKTAQDKAEKAVQEHLFTLQRAADAAQAITWHQTLEGAMQEIAEQARGVIGAHQAVVRLSGDGCSLQTLQAQSLSKKYAAGQDQMAPLDSNGFHAMVCENNRAIRMTQAALEAHPRWRGFAHCPDKHPVMRGWLAVPLTGRNGTTIGSLQLADRYEGEFTQQDEYVALELGHLASTAIGNALLLEEVRQLNAGLEQKVLERTVALARQESLFRALAEQAPQTIWTCDAGGGCTYCNRTWFDLMGGGLDDWTGHQWLTAVHPDDVADIKANWKTASASKSLYAGIRRIRSKDGGFHTMAYRASPVLDDQGEVSFWVGIDADITELKAVEAALRLSNHELEAFSYSVSHDLRSPLNTIDGFSRLLAKQLATQFAGGTGDVGEKVAHYLSRIRAGVAQMGQLIEDLLSLSQVTRAQLRTESVDLSVMAHSLLDDWQTRQPERQVAVHIESGLQAEADGRLVRVVMENLLSNAWKFTSQRPPAQAEIRIGQKMDAAGSPVFFVQDNGAGFDMAYADKLFSPFQRLHAVTEFSGTGIGLATASRVIKRHGGRLWAESMPGAGATFFFTLS